MLVLKSTCEEHWSPCVCNLRKISAVRRSQNFSSTYTEIKVSDRNSLRISVSILQNHASVGWHCYIVFEHASYAHVSVTINLHTIEFISNLIEYDATQLLLNEHPGSLCSPRGTVLFSLSVSTIWRKKRSTNINKISQHLSFPLTYRKLSYGTDPVAVFLFRCTRTLCWRTGCTCESQSWRCDRRRSARL